eukprot:gnl/TRDRNA2_/TRDRNA2_51639_c0_seq1.p1 gnl/TRDRNA2_/TRDRNA2_51639_c0~~gnl/TRDRNA2_/TRDRNA2_51639_c0_seq1.p1  ORF type:complete len:375 (+),score=36.66 gnl/TRDRNA2_/TRDRNA2_51639_c0_seq1:97-1125(+)
MPADGWHALLGRDEVQPEQKEFLKCVIGCSQHLLSFVQHNPLPYAKEDHMDIRSMRAGSRSLVPLENRLPCHLLAALVAELSLADVSRLGAASRQWSVLTSKSPGWHREQEMLLQRYPFLVGVAVQRQAVALSDCEDLRRGVLEWRKFLSTKFRRAETAVAVLASIDSTTSRVASVQPHHLQVCVMATVAIASVMLMERGTSLLGLIGGGRRRLLAINLADAWLQAELFALRLLLEPWVVNLVGIPWMVAVGDLSSWLLAGWLRATLPGPLRRHYLQQKRLKRYLPTCAHVASRLSSLLVPLLWLLLWQRHHRRAAVSAVLSERQIHQHTSRIKMSMTFPSA